MRLWEGREMLGSRMMATDTTRGAWVQMGVIYAQCSWSIVHGILCPNVPVRRLTVAIRCHRLCSGMHPDDSRAGNWAPHGSYAVKHQDSRYPRWS